MEGVIKKGIELGFKQIAITDHSYSNIFLCLTPKKVEKQHKEIDILQKKYPQIEILKGIEANILDEEGSFDLSLEDCKIFDVINLGFHRHLKLINLKTKKFQLANGFVNEVFPKLINTTERAQRNTDSYIEIIEKYPISTLAHINNGTKVDHVRLATACSKCGTYVEINRLFFKLIDPILDELVSKTDCTFIIDSDAHKIDDIGDYTKARKAIADGRVPLNRIANYKRFPEFRSTK